MPKSATIVALLAFTLFQEPATRLHVQRGKIQSITPTQITLEAVDLPPTTFDLTPETEKGPLKPDELVQVTFTIADGHKTARIVAEIVATPINLPHGSAPGASRTATARIPRGSSSTATGTSTTVDLPKGAIREDASAVADVTLPSATGRTPPPISAAPISLAADESQLQRLRAPEIHQSGVRNPIRLALLDFQLAPARDLPEDLGTTVPDHLASLLQNDGLFTLLSRSSVPQSADILQLAKTLDNPDAILLGDIREEIPNDTPPDGPRHKIQAIFPTIILDARLYDAHTGRLIAEPKGQGGGSQDRADAHPSDRTSPILRAVRDAVETLAASIDPEYPPLLDPRTFATVVSADASHLTVAFAGIPTVQLGNRLQVSHPLAFARSPSGAIEAVSPDPLGILTITGISKSDATGTYQGTPPSPGQTIRLSR